MSVVEPLKNSVYSNPIHTIHNEQICLGVEKLARTEEDRKKEENPT